MTRPLLEVRGLRVELACAAPRARAPIAAVEDVSLEVAAGETLGLVGESGCGKTTLARALLRLVEPVRGQIVFDGRDLTAMRPGQVRPLRRALQMVFQDSASALDPRLCAGDAIGEALDIHGLARAEQRPRRILALLDSVGLPHEVAARYPHELSGGQRQRVALARALAVEPRLIVADEPLAGLDRSVQAQIANLLLALQRERGLAYLLISHDLERVEHLADRVAVMYLGRLVETAPAATLFSKPCHPYTRALLSARLGGCGPGEPRVVLVGEPPSPAAPPEGCRLHPRCPFAVELCAREPPSTRCLDAGRSVACHRAEELLAGLRVPPRAKRPG